MGVDDMDLSALPKTNYIKSIITSECKMDLERKGVQSYQSLLYVRFLCFGNGALTALHDQSDGFFRRQIVLTTRDRPADRVDDPFLAEKLAAEREGIFLWCLEGLHRLIAQNYRFTISPKAQENVETVRRGSNNVVEFLQSEGYIRFRADYEASSKSIYKAYKVWCEDNVRKPLSANRLSSELTQNAAVYNVEPTNNIYSGGRRVRGFVGIEVVARPLAEIEVRFCCTYCTVRTEDFRFSLRIRRQNDYANFKACANRELFHGRKHRLSCLVIYRAVKPHRPAVRKHTVANKTPPDGKAGWGHV